jgi:acyl-CoA synthetase (AMP-forming)/AMP-acid ligase II
MYGQTEAAPRMTTLPSHVFPGKPDSVGCSVPGGQIEIADENGALLSPETVGRIVYRGPNVMWGYATSRACLARGDELNGRLETGDIGRLDADGYLYIIGRNQRFAKIAGLRISIDEIEQRLKPKFDVALMPDTESVRIYFSSPEGDTETLAQCLSDLAGEYRIPLRSFVLVPVAAIPLKANGKVDFARLSALA